MVFNTKIIMIPTYYIIPISMLGIMVEGTKIKIQGILKQNTK